MTHFVLVHGGWHGAWCWDALIRELEDSGHEAVAVNLPSDELGVGAADYAAVVAEQVVPGESAVVGHSLAGLALPLIPAIVPPAQLIYLAALLPLPGWSWRDQLPLHPMADWFYTHALPDQRQDGFRRSFWPAATAEALFFHDCETAVSQSSAERLRTQSPTPVAEKTPLVAFPDTPSHYVIGREDRAVSVDWSAAAVPERLGSDPILIEGGHSPFLARPRELARLLIDLASTQALSETNGDPS